MPESRVKILDRFRAKIAQGLPIIGGGAGTGISAKMEEAGGIDLIVIYNSNASAGKDISWPVTYDACWRWRICDHDG